MGCCWLPCVVSHLFSTMNVARIASIYMPFNKSIREGIILFLSSLLAQRQEGKKMYGVYANVFVCALIESALHSRRRQRRRRQAAKQRKEKADTHTYTTLALALSHRFFVFLSFARSLSNVACCLHIHHHHYSTRTQLLQSY